MAAPKQSDWTAEVDWTNQCEGIDWSQHPEPTEADDLLTRVGHLPKIRKFDGGVGMAFIDVEEKKSQERQAEVDAKILEGNGLPGRWDHAERHKSHRKRFQQGQMHRKRTLRELVVHVVCRPDENTVLANEIEKLLCEKCNMIQLTDDKKYQHNSKNNEHPDISSNENALTYCGGIEELTHFFQSLKSLPPELRDRFRCESSDFTLLGQFPNILRPLNGAGIQFQANGTTYIPPIAPQRRVQYNRSALCRISEPMKLIDADYGQHDTIWIRMISNNKNILSKGKLRTKDELSREAGLFTEPHHPTKVFVPPPKPNVVEMGRGASTSAIISHVPSPVRRSKPSGDIKNYLFKNATKWANETELRAKAEREIQREIKEYLMRNNAVVKKRVPNSPRSLKALFKKKRIKAENESKSQKAIALRKWRESRIQDLTLVVGGLDLSMVPNVALMRCRQVAQYGVRRVYDRHLEQRPPSARLPKPQNEKVESDDFKSQPLAETALLEEFFRKMRIVVSGGDITKDAQLASILHEPVDPVTGQYLLHVACSFQRLIHIRVLLSIPQVDVNQIEFVQHRTPLHIASKVDSLEMMELFLSRGADLDIDASDINGWTPLHVAAHAGNTQIVQLLLPLSGKNGKLQTINGDSPLHLASGMGNYSTIEIMLLYYQSIPILNTNNSVGNGSNTTQSTTEHSQSPEFMESTDTAVAIENADVLRLTNNTGCIPLHIAAANGHLKVVKKLADSFKPVKISGNWVNIFMIRDDNEDIPLMHALRNDQNNCALFLWNELVSKKFRRVPKGDALRSLELSVRRNNIILVKKICDDIPGIENTVGVEDKNKGEGPTWNCVHLASHLGFNNVISTMVSCGNADMNQEDGEAMRPLDLSCMAGHRLSSTAILDAGGIMGRETMSKRAKKLWKKALTTVTGSIRDGVIEQERLMRRLNICDAALKKALATRNAVAIIEATDDYQEAKLSLEEFREYFHNEGST
jgi:ankyrin repeat protein